MKKILSISLALVMMLSLGIVAFAETPADFTFNIPVYYLAENAGTKKPAESFTLTIGDCSAVANSSLTKEQAPAFASKTKTLAFAASTAAEDLKFADFTIKGGSITNVGVFTYPMTITHANNYAGITYDDKGAVLTVYITYDEDGNLVPGYTVKYDDKKVVGGQWNDDKGAYEKTEDTTPAKSCFTNIYRAAAQDTPTEAKGLAVSKTVTGAFGDKTKEFKVTVSFSSPVAVPSEITYTEDATSKTVAAFTQAKGGDPYTASAVIYLKDGETITFNNVPYGVTYTVTEDDYTADGYDEADIDNETGTVADVSVSVSITNNKGGAPDEGVWLDYAPYFVIIALVAAGFVLMLMKKRKAAAM